MRFFVYRENLMGVHVSVALSRRKANVAQKLLNRPEIRPSSQKVGGKAVAERMRASALRQSQCPHALGNVPPDASIGQSTATGVHEQGLGAGPGASARRQVGSQRGL